MQLNTIGAVPIVNLVRHGYAAKFPYNQIVANIEPHISNKANICIKDLCHDVLDVIGCDKTLFKIGRSQIFFRTNSEKFVDYIFNMNEETARKIAEEASQKYLIRRRNEQRIVSSTPSTQIHGRPDASALDQNQEEAQAILPQPEQAALDNSSSIDATVGEFGEVGITSEFTDINTNIEDIFLLFLSHIVE